MMYIPEGIVIEILLRLPIKSLFRFRLVRKSWCKYLKYNTDFVKKQLNHSIESDKHQLLYTSNAGGVFTIDQSLLVSNDVVQIQKVDSPYGRWGRRIQILGSCHGLICITVDADWATGLWNPATTEYKILPKAATPIGFNSFVTSYGFGYDDKINDYKLVRVVSPSAADTTVSEVEVYTLGSDSWRRIKSIPYKIPGRSSGVFVKGASHWIANPCPSTRLNSKFSHVILSFNVSEEVFNEIPYIVSFEKFEHKRIDIFEGLLCMVCSSNVGFEIWVMSDYGVRDSWSKLYTISQSKLVDSVPSFRHLRRIHPLRNGEVMLEIQIDDLYAALVFYDPKHEKARVMKMDPEEYIGGWNHTARLESKCYTEIYAESLISLHSGNYVGGEPNDSSYSDESDDDMGYWIAD